VANIAPGFSREQRDLKLNEMVGCEDLVGAYEVFEVFANAVELSAADNSEQELPSELPEGTMIAMFREGTELRVEGYDFLPERILGLPSNEALESFQTVIQNQGIRVVAHPERDENAGTTCQELVSRFEGSGQIAPVECIPDDSGGCKVCLYSSIGAVEISYWQNDGKYHLTLYDETMQQLHWVEDGTSLRFIEDGVFDPNGEFVTLEVV